MFCHGFVSFLAKLHAFCKKQAYVVWYDVLACLVKNNFVVIGSNAFTRNTVSIFLNKKFDEFDEDDDDDDDDDDDELFLPNGWLTKGNCGFGHFTKEILKGKLHFLCSAIIASLRSFFEWFCEPLKTTSTTASLITNCVKYLNFI